MSKGYSGLFHGTSGNNISNALSAITNTSEVWNHITSTAENYSGTVIPKSFEINTPAGKMWTHGNATEHMYEAVTSI